MLLLRVGASLLAVWCEGTVIAMGRPALDLLFGLGDAGARSFAMIYD